MIRYVRLLAPGGPLLGPLGARRLDELDAATLRAWWAELSHRTSRKARHARPIALKTARAYVDVLAAIFTYARELGLLDGPDPIAPLRAAIRRRARTQRGRAEADAAKARPVEGAADVERLVAAARATGGAVAVVVLLGLDAGLRMGETLALTWKCVGFGRDADDVRGRVLTIAASRARGGDHVGPPKSGRTRRVALSRRLRAALGEAHLAAGAPGPDALVLPGFNYDTFTRTAWRALLKRAGLAGREIQFKDLRDTFASQLLTAGVSLGYVSRQLGHADAAITANAYARWCGGDDYVVPTPLRPGEVPADFLARLGNASPAPDRRRHRRPGPIGARVRGLEVSRLGLA